MENQMTVRELRRTFFEHDNFYAVLDGKKLTNTEIRRALFELEDQEAIINCRQMPGWESDCIIIQN